MQAADWNGGTALAILFESAAKDEGDWLVLVNAGPEAVSFLLPAGSWQCRLSTDPALDSGAAVQAPQAGMAEVPRSSLWIARR
jgi:glycogen operon protein